MDENQYNIRRKAITRWQHSKKLDVLNALVTLNKRRPADWFSTTEIAEEAGIGNVMVRHHIYSLRNEGYAVVRSESESPYHWQYTGKRFDEDAES